MPNTTTWSITYPDSSSNLTPLENHFSSIATTTDTALTNLKTSIRGSDSTSTIGTLSTALAAVNTRLALNLQTSSGTPTGAPVNSGVEGSMHWDTSGNALWIYDAVAGWQRVWVDAGWQNITVSLGFGGGTGLYVPKYRIIGNVVYLRGYFLSTGLVAANTEYSVGTIPAAAYPSSDTQFAIATSSTDQTKNGKLTISTGGVLKINTGSITGGVPSYYINCSYPIG